jgi:hypothetical protein
MNRLKFLAATAALVASSASAFAESSITDSQSVLLGFRSASVADATVITNSANAGKFLFVGLDGYNQQSDIQLSAILTSTFGTNWFYNGGDIKWGIFGASPFDYTDSDTTARTGFAFFGAATNSGITLANADWDNGYQAYSSVIDTIKANLVAEGISTNAAGIRYGTLASGDVAGTETQLTEKIGTLTGFAGPGTEFPAFYNLSTVTSLEINFLTPNDDRNAFAAHDITGIATLDSTGKLVVAPEPSTYALMGLGAVMLFFVARRARKA